MIAVDEAICTGCRSCEFACSFQQKKRFHDSFSLVKVRRNSQRPGFFIPSLCHHCEDPPCKAECPTGAISKDKASGIVSIDHENCTACDICVEACPWSVPTVYPDEGYAKVCDLCQGDPLCVKFCCPGALRVER